MGSAITTAKEDKNSNILLLGMKWMQDMKLTFNLKEQTIKAYYNYNCIY